MNVKLLTSAARAKVTATDRPVAFALVIGLAVAIFSATSFAASGHAGWPTAGGGPGRNPLVDADLSRALFPRWSFSLDEVSLAAPVVSGGTVYAGTDSGAVFALDARTGVEKWRFTAGTSGWSKVRALTVAGEAVFAVGSVRDQTGFVEQTGAIYALDAGTGSPRWRFDLSERSFSAPAAAGGAVIVGSNDGTVIAVDASTGKEKWRKRVVTPGGGWNSIRSSVAVSGDTAVVAAYDGSVYAFDATDGRQLWRVAVGAYFEPNSAPVISGDTVYVASSQDQSGAVAAINLPSGELRWKYQAPDQDNLWMNPAVSGRMVIVPNQGALYVLDAGNGSLISLAPTPTFKSRGLTYRPNPVIAAAGRDHVYAQANYLQPSAPREIYAADARTGRVYWRSPIPGRMMSPAAFSGGSLYFAVADDEEENPRLLAVSPVTVIVDGSAVAFPDTPPFLDQVSSRMLVPSRQFLEAAGARVQWIPTTNTAVARRGDLAIEITEGSARAKVNGVSKDLNVPARIVDGRLMVPLRGTATALGARVDWDAAALTARVTFPPAAAE